MKTGGTHRDPLRSWSMVARVSDPSARALPRRPTRLGLAIGRALDIPVELRYIDRRDIDNIRRRVVNIEKARRMLRWTPQVTLETGLSRTAEWFVRSGMAEQPSGAEEHVEPIERP